MLRFTSAIERSLLTENWYSALAMSLLLPDICGKIDNPSLSSTKRYVRWYEHWLQPLYTVGGGDVMLSGADCYALRCSLMHEGSGNVEKQPVAERVGKFVFCKPARGLIIHCNSIDDILQLQVDIFANDMCAAVKAWHVSAAQDPIRKAAMTELLPIHDPREGIPGLVSFGD
ncbi:hypothetical protein [Oryzibacter oryziterrae]|uniref:hypothetical protein n=1 Tax=Oryzibacter oryziterrae TaxID=2766474 RepID=UPI001F321531|nr:hypothetical protein [Oryzibacter oryziterrae]